ncbi:MAG: alpha-L-fucosidase [Planctomycetota bacterium]|nr:alpha-L-fucosidase [Planctomycetota bacterium]
MALKRMSLYGLAVLLMAAGLAQAAADLKDDPLTSPRTAWFREAKFGMFIHWGVYAVPAGVYDGKEVKGIGEWIMNNAKIPIPEYEKFAAQFNPVKFDAKEWAHVAKAAGMKYMVITSKHHDGFCMFDTHLTDYNIVKATPWKHDPMKDLAAACKADGLKFCFYHSIMDWHMPDQNTDFPKYSEHLRGQLKELLTQYGPIGILWFDGEWIKPWDEKKGADLYAYCRSIQPDLIINNRVGKRKVTDGDYETPEQTIPAGRIQGRLWETCMTLNDTWGFKTSDHHWKPTSELVHKLIDIVSKGGNFLLNVGPTAEGVIPPESVQRLEEVGKWMATNGEAIYGTSASPWKKHAFDGRCTVKGSTLYVHVFKWPDGPLSLTGLKGEVAGVEALDKSAGAVKYEFKKDGGTLSLEKPAKLDPIATVVAVKFKDAPAIDEAVTAAAAGRQAADGKISLRWNDAELHGGKIKAEPDKDAIGFWTDANDWVSWDVTVDKPGTFEATVTYATGQGCGGAQAVLSAGDAEIAFKTRETGTWTTFADEKVGSLKIAQAGKVTIALKAKSVRGGVMNLKAVDLKPVTP